MTKATLLTLITAILFAGSASAQTQKTATASPGYTTALGIKFYPGAVSIKHFISRTAAVEGLGYFWNRGSRITGLYEIHGNINGAPGLRWYVGPGAHIGFYNQRYGGGASVGIDGVLGLDYKFKAAPVNLSIDWQPSLEFSDKRDKRFVGDWAGFAVRYTF